MKENKFWVIAGIAILVSMAWQLFAFRYLGYFLHRGVALKIVTIYGTPAIMIYVLLVAFGFEAGGWFWKLLAFAGCVIAAGLSTEILIVGACGLYPKECF